MAAEDLLGALRRSPADAHACHSCRGQGGCGWPRMHEEWLARGIRVGKDTGCASLCRAASEPRASANSGLRPTASTPPAGGADLLQCRLSPEAPNRPWCGDTRTLPTTRAGCTWRRLSTCSAARCWAGACSSTGRSAWSGMPWPWARWRRRPAPGLIFHSDRGGQYWCGDFQAALKGSEMRSSISRKGNRWDNAPTESIWGG